MASRLSLELWKCEKVLRRAGRAQRAVGEQFAKLGVFGLPILGLEAALAPTLHENGRQRIVGR